MTVFFRGFWQDLCKSKLELVRIQNPTQNLKFEMKSKGVQYFLPEKNGKDMIIFMRNCYYFSV
jgi:hypothetical protein